MRTLEKMHKAVLNYGSVASYSLYIWKEIEAYYHEKNICLKSESELTEFEKFVIEGMALLREQAQFYDEKNAKGL